MRTQSQNLKSTEHRLLTTARELFAANGFELTTTRMIALKAGVAQSAISFHYGTKENLAQAVVDYTISLMTNVHSKTAKEVRDKISSGTLTKEEAWKYMDRIVTTQIKYSLDPRDLTTMRLLIRDTTFPPGITGKLSKAAFDLVEDPLSLLIHLVSGSKDYYWALVVTQAINGAITTFVERPLMVECAFRAAKDGFQKDALATYLHDFLMDSLHSIIEKMPDSKDILPAENRR